MTTPKQQAGYDSMTNWNMNIDVLRRILKGETYETIAELYECTASNIGRIRNSMGKMTVKEVIDIKLSLKKTEKYKCDKCGKESIRKL